MTTTSQSHAAPTTGLANPTRVRRRTARRAVTRDHPGRVQPQPQSTIEGSSSPLVMPLLWEGDQN